VCLQMTGDQLVVLVRDEGCGFDLKELHQHEGLGIRSMKERTRSLGGKFEIHSESGKGTTLEARVPLKPEPGLVKS
jgi:signal transduction histidine kinase